MKRNAIFIDLRNVEHVKWWNKIASKLVKVVEYNSIVETATGKPIGYIFVIKGLFKNFIIKENISFLKDPKSMVINIKK